MLYPPYYTCLSRQIDKGSFIRMKISYTHTQARGDCIRCCKIIDPRGYLIFFRFFFFIIIRKLWMLKTILILMHSTACFWPIRHLSNKWWTFGPRVRTIFLFVSFIYFSFFMSWNYTSRVTYWRDGKSGKSAISLIRPCLLIQSRYLVTVLVPRETIGTIKLIVLSLLVLWEGTIVFPKSSNNRNRDHLGYLWKIKNRGSIQRTMRQLETVYLITCHWTT